MGKKIILLLFFLAITNLSFAQIRSYDNLFFELYNTEDNVFFSDSIEPGWSKTAFGRRVKYEYITVKDRSLLIAYTSVCSGLSCWNVECYKKYDNRWYLVAKTLAYTPFSPSDSFLSYFDTESNNIVFEFDGKILGTLKEDFLYGNIPVNQTENNKIIYSINSVSYTIDLENHIVYKIDTCVTIPSETNVQSSNLIAEGGTMYITENNIRQTIVAKQILKRNISIGYFNPSMSHSQKNIVCEQRICHKKDILKCNIVEINADSHVIKVLSSGYEPHYSPLSDRYILYHSDYYFYIFDTILNESILSFSADVAEWCLRQ
ncbi:MAG: hypothetical protein J6V74_05150 [Bacteroidales bacterium]|nr:hypothetical protein [Bacteroidales bacterium]